LISFRQGANCDSYLAVMRMRGKTEATAWPDDIVQLLDDHHLVVLSDDAAVRRRFADSLQQQLRVLGDTDVVEIEGSAATDLPSFCRQLEGRLHIRRDAVNPWWRDMQSVINVLRRAGSGPKRRYFLWHDADAMLEADVELFCHLVNAFFGVAAEFEHVSLDPVVLQRVIFLGGAKLGAYAEDVNGQFCRWLDEEGDESPFWEVASMVERPPVITYRIDG
jgi:hypothetical protein